MQRQATNLANVLSLLGAFLTAAVVLGLLAAGLVMPAVGATGAATRQGVGLFDALPGDLATNPLAQQSRVLAADGSVITTPAAENRIVVPLKQIAPIMRKAQVAIEDARFYEHGGIDPQGVARALVFNALNSGKQGASTLTQQYVKVSQQENALSQGDPAAARAATTQKGINGYLRKLEELKYAVTLEKKLTKDQILEGYLNLVYYGDQAYGIEAAARHYFGIHASQLNLPQSALLAGVVNQPGVSDPVHYPEAAVKRRNVVLNSMHTHHLITDAAWKKAKASKLVLHVTDSQQSCASSSDPYFCGYVMAWLRQSPALGKSPQERIRKLERGGLTIKTTLDPKLAKIARQQLVKAVPIGNDLQLGAATAMVEPGTGHVLAIAQNTTYSNTEGKGKTSVNYSVDQRYGSSGGFQIGSTAKLFTIAAALNSGMPIDSTINVRRPTDGEKAVFTHKDFPNNKCGGAIQTPWSVGNDNGAFSGKVSLTKMTAQSINTAFAELVAKLGTCDVRDTMTAMGLHEASGKPIEPYPAVVTLGSDNSSPLSVASAFATVAADGKYCPPNPVVSITTATGKAVPLPAEKCTQALKPDVAQGVSKIFASVFDKNGTATGDALADNRPAAGKTGTTDGGNESWFTGFTPQLSTAVWVGTPKTNQQKVRDFTLAGKFHKSWLFGSTIAAPTWKAIMDQALKGQPIEQFSQPSDTMAHGDRVTVPSVAGMSVADARTTLENAGFTPKDGRVLPSTYLVNTVVSTSPDAGNQAIKGSDVSVNTSSGYVPAAPPPPQPQPTTAPKASPSPKPTPSTTPPKPSPKPTTPPKPKGKKPTKPPKPAGPTG